MKEKLIKLTEQLAGLLPPGHTKTPETIIKELTSAIPQTTINITYTMTSDFDIEVNIKEQRATLKTTYSGRVITDQWLSCANGLREYVDEFNYGTQ